MKRFHVHVSVKNLEESIRFYSNLFGSGPTIRKPDYAKWMVDDPRINFAISPGHSKAGINHLGLQVDEADELPAIKERFAAADSASVTDQVGVTCCYAKSDKHWVTDPQGIAWEGWHSLGQVEMYEGAEPTAKESLEPSVKTQSGCCSPSSADKPMSAAEKRGCCA